MGVDETVADLAARSAGLDEAHARIADRFRRPEPRRRALANLRGLRGQLERTNGWQLAEALGEATPARSSSIRQGRAIPLHGVRAPRADRRVRTP